MGRVPIKLFVFLHNPTFLLFTVFPICLVAFYFVDENVFNLHHSLSICCFGLKKFSQLSILYFQLRHLINCKHSYFSVNSSWKLTSMCDEI